MSEPEIIRPNLDTMRAPATKLGYTSEGKSVNWPMLIVIFLVIAIVVYLILIYSGWAWLQETDQNGNVTVNQGKAVGLAILAGLLIVILIAYCK